MKQTQIWASYFLSVAVYVVGAEAVSAQAPVDSVQRQELASRLSSYGSCNASCAKDLAGLIADEGVSSALVVLGLTKGNSKLLKGPVGYLSAYAAFVKIKASGGKIIDTYKVCVQTCDGLYKDVVDLGSAGLLGPITKDTPVPETWFADPKVKAIWEKYIRPLNSQELPAQFHNDARWKEIADTA